MKNIDWTTIKLEDLKNSEYLVKCFRKYLKKDCKYSADEAKFAADVIENPFAKNCSVTKKRVHTLELGGTMYEIYACTVADCAPQMFEFFTLVDISTIQEKDEEWFAYYLAKKKFVICSE